MAVAGSITGGYILPTDVPYRYHPTGKHTMRLVLTHENCSDGYCAAVIAHWCEPKDTIFRETQPSGLEQYLVSLFSAIARPTSIRCFDLSFSPEALALCLEQTPDVEIYDHHKTTVDRFGGTLPPQVHYDVARSGARLAWDYYMDTPSPALVNLIEARDLWLFERVQQSREITDVLYATYSPRHSEENLKDWTALLLKDMAYFEEMLQTSSVLLRAKQLQIDEALRGGAQRTLQMGDHTYAAFVCNSDTHISDLGNAALRLQNTDGTRRYDLALLWSWKEQHQHFTVSLRSCNESPADVSQIAAHFGGGGHRNAAGFTATSLDFLHFTAFPKK